VTWIALNLFGFWRMGPNAFATYRHSIGGLEELGYINSPDLWRPVALPRLDWTALFYFFSANLTFSRTATLALAGLCGLWLLWIIVRSGGRPQPRLVAPFLGALVCLGSLSVYHHQYDAVLFFAPALFGLLVHRQRPGLAHLLIAPLVIVILLLPIGSAQNVLQSLLGLLGVALLKIMFPVVFTLALVGCLLLMKDDRLASMESP
jgi:hypothetical protein